MALFKFTKAILSGETIDVYNHGEMSRDFTYIDDLVHGMRLLVDAIPEGRNSSEENAGKMDSKSRVAPFRVVNIGNSQPSKLLDFIEAIEESIGIEAVKNFMPMQAGDVPATWADITLLKELTGYTPSTELNVGVQSLLSWFHTYYES